MDINDNTMEVRCFLYSCMLLLGLGGEVVSAQTFRRIKNVRERWIANMDGDYHNLGEICTMKKLPTHVIAGGKEQNHYDKMDVMGFTCLEQDVMVPEWNGELAEGDVMVFDNCGGYSIVDKPQFIKPQSAMYVKRCDGTVKMIMRAETFDDVFNKFSFEF